MPEIDLEPRKHSHLYELKPMSRWWMVLMLVMSVVGIAGNGWNNPSTWFLLLNGWGLGLATLLTNPKKWLTKDQ